MKDLIPHHMLTSRERAASSFRMWIFGTLVFGAVVFLTVAIRSMAFVGPVQGTGAGTGAIGVNTANNVSIGTSTPRSDTKLLIVASSSASTDFAFQVLQSAGGPVFVVRNDGKVGIGALPSGGNTLYVNGDTTVNGAVAATGVSGAFAGTVPAGNVSPGVFASVTGNFAFRSSLGINTSTQAVPQALSVYGNVYVSGNVGIGTSSPVSALHVANGLYAQFENQIAGAPIAGDCNAMAERGRMIMDTTNNRFYICSGTSTARWGYVDLQ